MILTYIVQRLLLAIFVLLGVSLLVFSLARFAPGDPLHAALGLDYTPEVAAEMERELGLDKPLPEQYLSWVGGVVRGDFGRSIVMREEVGALILQRLPITMAIAGGAVAIALVVSIPLGVISAVNKDSWVDNTVRIIAILGVSMPVFWLGILLLILFAVQLGVLPASGGVREHGFQALLLPAITLSTAFAALITRMVRSTMLEVLGEDYIRTARAKGLAAKRLYIQHALRNALIPVITVVGLQFGTVLGGAVVTETIFNIPGLGRLIIEAASMRDYPLIQGVVLVTASAFVLVNLIVDVLYVLVNPQIRYN